MGGRRSNPRRRSDNAPIILVDAAGGPHGRPVLFTTFWENESKTTRNVIARIPEGSDYRPDPKSRTASEIAWQIACEEKMLIEAIETGKAEWTPAPAPATMREMLDTMRSRARTSSGG